MSDQNTKKTRPIVVGKKPTANYALAVASRLGEGETLITLRARGALAGKALDTANKAVNMGLSVGRGDAHWGQEAGPKGEPVSFLEVTLFALSGA